MLIPWPLLMGAFFIYGFLMGLGYIHMGANPQVQATQQLAWMLPCSAIVFATSLVGLLMVIYFAIKLSSGRSSP